MRKGAPLLILISAAIFMSCASTKGSIKESSGSGWKEERNGQLSFSHYFEADVGMRFTFSFEELPDKVLLFTKRAIEYALEVGAAREINKRDFFHGHFLFREERPKAERNIETVDAMVFHTQEYVFYSEESFLKRNIFVGPDGIPRVLPCNATRSAKGELSCTVFIAKGLSLLGGVSGVYFVVVDDIPEKKLKKYARNIILIRGQKVLVGQPL